MKNIILMAFLCIATASLAQDKPKLYTLPSPFERYNYSLATIRFGAAVPIGQLSDQYIDKATFKNFSASLEWVLPNRLSIGGEIGSSNLQKRIPRAVYEFEDQTISAVQTRTLVLQPFQAFVNYHFANKNDRIQPYIQLSGGGSRVDYSLYYGNLVDQYQKIRPTYGVGVGSKFLFKPDGSVGADLRAKYTNTPFKYDYIDGNASTLNVSVGIFYRWW
ncbi:hypothetical protein CLV98_102117 [Dyadobacter jejuensis]|uniref:Outer membrane protein with beta-barrel domain n=1 Tax=Dyadobacter jejuensis TaxID=1082580 RepID=A0A316ANF4_9BACT|nr:outer membrane beta-barrel protein [Dyadobacter jejuensis]PWJ59285.1 hypothetical protein CLV98_102117 [Dyadobacter jejuensis]